LKKLANSNSNPVLQGARVLCGGKRVLMTGVLSRGHFLAPCVLGDCRDEMRVVQDEVFGAVLAMLTFSNDEEVLTRANQTQFGLAGGVFTRYLARGVLVL
jgi:acyl-CoA reductase-like NAD-dependent aldehyde dehydrogenase